MTKSFYVHRKDAFLMLAMLLALTGCAKTVPSRFYSLSAATGDSSQSASGAVEDEIALGVGPLKLPDYLDRPQIITREDQNQIAMAEFDRWAGRLDDDLLRVISENLASLLSTDRVTVYPWRRSMPLDYQVEIEILQFDGRPGQGAVLNARWTVTAIEKKEVIAMKRSNISEPAVGADYAGLVEAQSRAVGALSREISSEITRISQGKE